MTPRITAGFESTDPRTGTRLQVVKAEREMGGRGWVLEVTCPEGAPAAVVEHIHLTWTETFEIVEGEALYRVDKKDVALRPGESITTPPGSPHVHPWNVGKGPLVYRQINDFGGVSPGAADEVLGVFVTINGLARLGKTDAQGRPRNPLQLLASVRTLNKHEGYDAKIPIWLQRGMSATLGRVAEALGYRGVDSRYW
jgi:mannose-6-phosphate isomerase-like protein (cupin superfamily)